LSLILTQPGIRDSRLGRQGAGQNGARRTSPDPEEEVPVTMSRAEAGRKGGLTTKKRYGADFYQRIGRKGGKKGGLTTKQRYGPDFYRSIGRKGGSR
jgi:uncharacterized protein